MADNDLFGDSSSDENTDDLLTAAAKSQQIARPKEPKKKKATNNKSQPDADNDSSDDSDSDSDNEAAGLFDSSSEDEDDSPVKKRTKLGGKKKKKAAAKKSKPIKKDTRSKQERMEALARKRAAGSGTGSSPDAKDKPRKKRSKPNKEIDPNKPKKGEDGYESSQSYDSATFQRTKDDDDFIDADDEDPDALKELYAEQKFEEVDSDMEEKETKKKKSGGSGSRKSSGGGLDKISLSDDEGDETTSASNALKAAVKRMQKKKKEQKKLPQLEEEGIVFLKQMEAAADADDESIKNRQPAVKKLGMLQQVMDTLAKKDMVRVLLDLELLSICKRWIQPLPNGTLGNVTLRRRIMESIAAMSGENGINSYDLKKSGFGKVVMCLYMHKSETPDMKKMLKGIIEQWSRPIFQKSGDLRHLERAQRDRATYDQPSGSLEEKRRSSAGGSAPVGRGVKTEDELSRIIASGSKATAEVGNNRVRVPFSKGFQYSVRPESRKGDVGDKRNLVSAKASAAANGSMMGDGDREKRDALSKKMADKSRKTNKQNQRSANISIEGRAVK